MKLPSETEMLVLETIGSLELSGIEIRDKFKAKHGKEISLDTLYTSLYRLKKSGWIDSKKDHESEDGRVKLFQMTSSGSQALGAARAFFEAREFLMEIP